jgi:MFS family permease
MQRELSAMGRTKVFGGWTNLVVAALAMVATLPGRTQGLGLVTEPLIADLGIDRVTYAGVNLWATLIGAAFCIPCGRWLDRFGSRVVLSSVLLALGATVILMSTATGLLGLAVAVTLTRGLGQSALSVASLALVGKWFERRLDVAMGVYSILVGIGFIAAFPSVGQAVLAFGWRTAWLAIGVLQLIVMVPLAWFVVGDHPEGERLAAAGAGSTDGLTDLGLWAALASPAFWVFALSSALFGLVYSGISLFNQSILQERGFDAATYYEVLAISTFVGLAANFGGGFLASRWPIQRVMAIGMAVLAAALVGLPSVASHAHVVLYGMAMGAAGGVVTVVFFSVWGRVFGRSQLGRIQGCAQMMTVFSSAVGPLLLAQTLERTGSYASIFYVLGAVVMVLSVGCWRVVLPGRVPVTHPGPLAAEGAGIP